MDQRAYTEEEKMWPAHVRDKLIAAREEAERDAAASFEKHRAALEAAFRALIDKSGFERSDYLEAAELLRNSAGDALRSQLWNCYSIIVAALDLAADFHKPKSE